MVDDDISVMHGKDTEEAEESSVAMDFDGISDPDAHVGRKAYLADPRLLLAHPVTCPTTGTPKRSPNTVSR